MLYIWHLKELRVLTEPRTISDKEKSIEKLPKSYPEIQLSQHAYIERLPLLLLVAKALHQ
jgi:hypothetical protein